MKIFLTFLSLLIIANLCFQVIAQDKAQAILVDEYANAFCSEEVRSRLDSFLVELQNNQGSIGYVIGHADSQMPGRFYKYWLTTQNHITKIRTQAPERFTFYRGENKDSMYFQLWMVPPGGSPPELPNEYKTDHIMTKTLFDKSSISSINGNEVFFGFESEEPCDWGLNLAEYANALKNDPTLTGLLSISPGKAFNGKKINARQALDLTTKLLVDTYGVDQDRIKTEIGSEDQCSELELWLIP